MINVNKIIEKYEKNEDDKSKPTSHELGIEQGGFREPAEKLVDELKKLGADLDWWMGDKTTTEFGVIQLGGEPLRIPIERVVEEVGFDYEKMMNIVESKAAHNLSIIKEEVDAEKMKEKMREGNVPSLVHEALEQFTRVKASDPRDLPLWVATLLKDHGYEEVDVETWFRANFLLDRILKARVASEFGEVIGGED